MKISTSTGSFDRNGGSSTACRCRNNVKFKFSWQSVTNIIVSPIVQEHPWTCVVGTNLYTTPGRTSPNFAYVKLNDVYIVILGQQLSVAPNSIRIESLDQSIDTELQKNNGASAMATALDKKVWSSVVVRCLLDTRRSARGKWDGSSVLLISSCRFVTLHHEHCG